MADISNSGILVVLKLNDPVRLYGKPTSIASDNGTEFTSRPILKLDQDN
jgi:putative transposase